jgi:hypothetical protein
MRAAAAAPAPPEEDTDWIDAVALKAADGD